MIKDGRNDNKIDLKGKKKEIYDFIVSYICENMFAPSLSEICEGVELKSKSSVYYYLRDREDLKLIQIFDGQPRAIKLRGYKIVKIDPDSRQVEEENASYN